MSSTGQVFSKPIPEKLFSANSAPSVMRVMGPRIAVTQLPSRPFIVGLPADAAVEPVYPRSDQQHRPEARDTLEVHQVQGVQQQDAAEYDQSDRDHGKVAAAAQVENARILVHRL